MTYPATPEEVQRAEDRLNALLRDRGMPLVCLHADVTVSVAGGWTRAVCDYCPSTGAATTVLGSVPRMPPWLWPGALGE